MDDRRDPSTSALLNTLLREQASGRIEGEGTERRVVIDLPTQGGSLEVPLLGEPGVGRWPVGRPWRVAADGTRTRPTADAVAAIVVQEPSLLAALGIGPVSPSMRRRFVERVADSARALEATLDERRDELDAIFTGPLRFLEAEQALLLGHSMHPVPRAHGSVTGDDPSAYLPTRAARVALEWIAVQRDRLQVSAVRPDRPVPFPTPERRPEGVPSTADVVLVPLHPLQARALLPVLERAERRGALWRLGPGPACWAPTSSMRTLHRPDAPVMLKHSLPVRLTNSMRLLHPAELERGLVLGRLLEHTEVGTLERDHPEFSILREPAHYGLVDDDGACHPASVVVLRDNPFGADAHAEVLATLLQDDPRDGCSRLAKRLTSAALAEGSSAVLLAEAWFERFLARACRPVFVAQAEHGLLLSAHQQNLVLGLRGVEIEHVWFRDAQGTAYGPRARERYGERVPELERACFVPPYDVRLFAYSFVINAIFNTIASLVMVPGVRQAWLLEMLRAELEGLRARTSGDPRGLAYLLDEPTIWGKRNLGCTLSDLDEATLADPSKIQHPMPNPLWREPPREPLVVDVAAQRVRLAGIDGDAWLELGGAEVDAHGVMRRRGSLDGAGLQLTVAPGPRSEVGWSGPPTDVALALVSEHLLATTPGLERVTHRVGASTDPRVVVREALLQRAQPWHHRRGRSVDPSAWVTSATAVHPWRPPTPPGLLYRRRCAAVDRVFSLHRFDPDQHFDAFVAWMNDPTVAEFWEQAWSRPRLSEYVETRLGDPHTVPMIGCFDDVPFAYFESYWAKEDRLGAYYDAGDYDRGFHMAVGDERFRFCGLGRHWFLAMAHFLFLDEPRTQRLVGEPRVDQARVRSWADSTAWRIEGTITMPHKRARLMTLRREDFFAQFSEASRERSGERSNVESGGAA
ncbi:GNAT family N-acetyltransferase [Paraliomyxa miuraensis]|uniref:GNAT family N-acetyltransferase n=1 Tax=Paraliomyxa miuraensis TaxID=376150 RepID=UPI0022523BEA|nr:GNAT family N-acetyltransferase [Paraliomyxa miuraensis]MCX4239968.1 GNAT family N-acetyltransferase [Paraliomyxa miuraensis]